MAYKWVHHIKYIWIYGITLRIHSWIFTVAKRTQFLRKFFLLHFKEKVTFNVNILNIVIVITAHWKPLLEHPQRGKWFARNKIYLFCTQILLKGDSCPFAEHFKVELTNWVYFGIVFFLNRTILKLSVLLETHKYGFLASNFENLGYKFYIVILSVKRTLSPRSHLDLENRVQRHFVFCLSVYYFSCSNFAIVENGFSFLCKLRNKSFLRLQPFCHSLNY